MEIEVESLRGELRSRRGTMGHAAGLTCMDAEQQVDDLRARAEKAERERDAARARLTVARADLEIAESRKSAVFMSLSDRARNAERDLAAAAPTPAPAPCDDRCVGMCNRGTVLHARGACGFRWTCDGTGPAHAKAAAPMPAPCPRCAGCGQTGVLGHGSPIPCPDCAKKEG